MDNILKNKKGFISVWGILISSLILIAAYILFIDFGMLLQTQSKLNKVAENVATGAATQTKIHYKYNKKGEIIEEYKLLDHSKVENIINKIETSSLNKKRISSVYTISNKRNFTKKISIDKQTYYLSKPYVDYRIKVTVRTPFLKKKITLSSVAIREINEQ